MSLVLDQQQNDTSTVLDLVRVVCTGAVVIGHALSFWGAGSAFRPPYFPYIQNLAVIGFFVLSGFLIARVLDRSRGGLAGFVIDRFARIYSAFIPCMILIGLIAVAISNDSEVAGPTFLNWAQNLAMLNGYADSLCSIVCAPNFYGAGHLWSLAVEWHLYMFAGCLFFSIMRRSVILLGFALVLGWVPFLYLGLDREMYPGNGITYVWAFGFAAYFATSRLNIDKRVACLMMIAAAVALLFIVHPAREYSMGVYVVTAIGFTGLVVATQATTAFRRYRRLENGITHVARFSFTLYLVHHPIQFAAHDLFPSAGELGAIIGVIVPIAVAILMARIGEYHHKALANALKRVVSHLSIKKAAGSR